MNQQPSNAAPPREPSPRPAYTLKQGQYLAFIYYYAKLNGVPPAEGDMQQFFRTSAPTVHQLVVTLERKGFIARTPGQARSIRLLLNRQEIPGLE